MLLSLSSELISAIFEYVDCITVIRCREVCSRLWDIISNDISIQYRLELFAQNMVDCGPLSAGGITTAARLEALKSFKWTCTPKLNQEGVIDINLFPITGVQLDRSADIVEIRNFNAPAEEPLAEEGFYEPQEDEYWPRSHGVVFRARQVVLHFVQLPGLVRGIPLKKWTVDLGMSLGEFYVDSTQDLIVVIPPQVLGDRIKLHLRRMIDGAEHPLASVPDMTLMLAGHTYQSITIYERYIVVPQRPPGVTILDWKLGKVVKRWLVPFYGYNFLDSRTFICMIINRTHPQIPHFQIYDVTQGNGSDHEFSPPTPILTLNCTPHPVSLTGSRLRFANAPSAPVVGTDPPFHSKPGGLIHFGLTWNDEDNKKTALLFFTSVSHLLELVSKERKKNPNLGITETQILDVKSWPNCSRTSPGNSALAESSTHGMRAIFSGPSGYFRDHWILDFNDRPWRKDTQAQHREDDTFPLKDFIAHNFPIPIVRKLSPRYCHNSIELVEDGMIGLLSWGSRYGNVAIMRT
ncbi:hypothetical protein BDN72DRAFT_963707 [Pluteus cervinus]|uniref:Uncharacterized protein n=1 Tax=Pluteus cervinus TaxID=181527 RepID=A0ACD3AFY5_9AGAR|nr:hypothetical protein BDN72DRAFT_963707 [Pluteus cervinus]